MPRSLRSGSCSEVGQLSFRLGTRGSSLAMAQANEIALTLSESGLSEGIELVTVRTTGDSEDMKRKPLEGSFVDEINKLVLEGKIDGGIHSMKDVPVRLPAGLCASVIPRRRNRVDCLVSTAYYTRLPPNSTIGTSSARRTSQLLHVRSDLRPVLLRGNVTTRISRVRDGEVDAVMLALCGLERLGFKGEGNLRVHSLPAEQFVPAAGQGALALITRKGRLPDSVIERGDHTATRHEVETERAVLELLNAGCNSPLGVSAQAIGNGVHLRVQLLSKDGVFERKISTYIRSRGELSEKLVTFMDPVSRSIINGGSSS